MTNLIRGASPLGLPDTRSRAPLRRRAPLAWLARHARSHRAASVAFVRRLLVSSEGLRPSDSPTRALARRFAGALPPPLKLRWTSPKRLRREGGPLAWLARTVQRASGCETAGYTPRCRAGRVRGHASRAPANSMSPRERASRRRLWAVACLVCGTALQYRFAVGAVQSDPAATARAAFAASLSWRTDRIVADQTHHLQGWLGATTPVAYTSPGALALTMRLETTAEHPIIVKRLPETSIFGGNLAERPFPVSIDLRGVADGDYQYVTEVRDGEVLLRSFTTPVKLVAGIYDGANHDTAPSAASRGHLRLLRQARTKIVDGRARSESVSGGRRRLRRGWMRQPLVHDGR